MVVEQKAQWCSADTGQATGSRTMASVFIVRDGWVMRVVRYPDLANAVHAARLRRVVWDTVSLALALASIR